MYAAIPIAISAFAAEISESLLLLNLLFLIPFLILRKDSVHLVLTGVIVCSSFMYFSKAVPPLSVTAASSFQWNDQVKIDGGKIKGFARLSDGTTVYLMYALQSESEKKKFQSINLAAYQFTADFEQKELEPAAHRFAFDMERYLRMNGAAGILEVTALHSVEEVSTVRSRLSNYRYQLKQHISERFPASLVTEAEALLIGDRSGMDSELQKQYQTLGITHLFAISGLHVGLLTFFIRTILLRAGFRREWVTYFLLGFLPIYACIAGGAPSVWRAVSVTMILLLAVSGKLRLRLDDALALSAACFIILQPHVVFQPGFQLSYLAAFSLLYSSAILQQAKNGLHVSFLVTVITQVALYPVLLYHFYELSLSSFAVNLLYVPLYSVFILPANLLLLACSFIMPPAARLLFSIYEPIRAAIGSFTSWLASFPFQMWTPGQPDGIGSIAAVAGILIFLVCLEKKKSVVFGLICLLLPAVFLEIKPLLHRDVIISYVDVGQGDSTVIELPFRKAVYVIDTGGVVHFGEKNWKTPEKPFEVGRNIIVPYLKAKGITTIDKLMITHADLDHMEGADEVLEELLIKEIQMPPGSEQEDTMEDVLRLAVEQKIPQKLVREGVNWRIGTYDFLYVAPSERAYEGNDSSLVLLMKAGEWTFVFPGDLETDGEKRLLSSYKGADFGRVILKAGHHGSKTSSTEPFIRFLMPELAIISAGRNSRYGHPHAEVTDRFEEYGIPYLSTAENGTIEIRVHKDSYSLQSSR
ncbi:MULTISPECIES: DNA internalization-related competence protein ComEC/Rec2 [unclassified Sporosarcina]|uniref:DNA internalization-related competence protein ComEC/Rec2 n=1 Tax=unclassified Sporosarcina TaxID=2647733 RepID=UPI00203E54DE|nr:MULTISPECIES: DNA internalization-related competence protein ComEC/Rec2 [unclassified Sporosarcina]GKV66744.1 DNA internalization-related competence protein ComEC/Rec2 [Sporosarcina sp. NCCP-2331]GLB57073.1 DNA internalization-related competence protein ComEC/Rec2 [Sporosarcina sp. NCCP-2378]